MRAAAYWAPDRADPLWDAGCAWLGRDPETGATPAQPPVEGIAPLTASPRRYGFHATLKPPMALATSFGAFAADAAALAARTVPFDLPPLEIAVIDGFLALRESAPCPALGALAAACVRELDLHRAPEAAERRETRRRGLDAVQSAHLDRWGYPHVLDRWRFHLTLSERMADPGPLAGAAAAHFAGVLGLPRRVAGLALYREDAPGAPFSVAARIGFG